MAKVTYTLRNFSVAKAKQGALCVLVADSLSAGDTVDNITSSGAPNSTQFRGAGICTFDASLAWLTVGGEHYSFDYNGNPSAPSRVEGFKLMMGVVQGSGTGNMGTVVSTSNSSTASRTRGDSGETISNVAVNYGEDHYVAVSGLTARDHFAMNALNQLLSGIKDPASLSDSQMSYYCEAAYRWAANMMVSAAGARIAVEDTGSTEELVVDSYDSNTEKLLKNIYTALVKTDEEVTSGTVTKHYERVTLKEAQDFITALEGISTAITGFRTSLNSRLQTIEDSIPDTSGLASQSDLDALEERVSALEDAE